jgi:hypothetical protein
MEGVGKLKIVGVPQKGRGGGVENQELNGGGRTDSS